MKNLIFTLVFIVVSLVVNAQPYNVTISIDMTSYTGSDYDAVVIGGGINGWNGALTLTNEPGTNIWSTTVQKEGWIDYRFEVTGGVVGWNCEFRDEATGAEVTGEGSCFTNPWDGNQTNVHWYEVTEDIVLPTISWESCECISCNPTIAPDVKTNQVEVFVSSSNLLMIKDLDQGTVNVSIYDIQGNLKIVKTVQSVGSELTMDCSQSLCSGLYIIKVETENSDIVKKIMIH
ncbi:T9SS type A sorting domain-containing protein [Plebeiibacterium sediminum]|uniref:T9SS type A sorting domain-containing protein n=1 Tax=Plebeiibacterium sediminum TaxID=2992112 RepID=A0AAE3M831_9BACT|nr:T9SS type A sorting domain-containing protein [Plebeiobacterium sediminum]MCW3788290.1 T9SS type A sorting domain-containing protein [Plebeiobacterium sediminum]